MSSHVEFQVRTKKKIERRDITEEVTKAASKLEAETGALLVSVPHTTAAVTVGENWDDDVTERRREGAGRVGAGREVRSRRGKFSGALSFRGDRRLLPPPARGRKARARPVAGNLLDRARRPARANRPRRGFGAGGRSRRRESLRTGAGSRLSRTLLRRTLAPRGSCARPTAGRGCRRERARRRGLFSRKGPARSSRTALGPGRARSAARGRAVPARPRRRRERACAPREPRRSSPLPSRCAAEAPRRTLRSRPGPAARRRKRQPREIARRVDRGPGAPSARPRPSIRPSESRDCFTRAARE